MPVVKKLLFTLLVLSLMSMYVEPIYAIDNPLTKPNNIFGIHILFPAEIKEAAALANSNNGDWGYVTIPIQAGDKDINKWQQFMNDCKTYHLIPIVRLATQGDYFNTQVWNKPTYADVLDFSNFLNSLSWPTTNRYIIVFNEVNRADEWDGQANPVEYAQILSYAITAFKSTNPNFFIISAGLDNAASTTGTSYNEYNFILEMNNTVPGIFNQVDGIDSHSYPNPGFSEPPSILNQESIASFQYERSLIETMTSKQLPIFITETGWPSYVGSESIIESYYKTAFSSVWNDKNIVAVTPFLLDAGAGPFASFSFINTDGSQSAAYKAIVSIPKIKGQPSFPKQVLGDTIIKSGNLPLQNFKHKDIHVITSAHFSHTTTALLEWLLGI